MSRPWMPLYVADYLGDTGHLSTLEHGAYMLLIMNYWQLGELPTGDEDLATITKLDVKSWQKISSVVLKLFAEGSWRDGIPPASRAVGIGRRDRRERIPSNVRSAVFARDGRRCVYCGDEAGPFHLDHKFPHSRGGRSTFDNLTVACQSCNCSKGALSVEEWLQ